MCKNNKQFSAAYLLKGLFYPCVFLLQVLLLLAHLSIVLRLQTTLHLELVGGAGPSQSLAVSFMLLFQRLHLCL